MSGHSKWSTIRHKKAIGDAKKGSVFSRIARQILVAVRQGGADETTNLGLRSALQEARLANMPKNNVRRVINKGLGLNQGISEEVIYEGYGPGGVGIMVTTVTDNKGRTGGEVKVIFDRAGGSLGSPGSVSYLRRMEQVPKVKLQGDELAKVDSLLNKLDSLEEVVVVWSNLERDE